ncbi:hypothetical protein [Wolbachia endosymbiont of Brugia pahangi]|uniref:hypothetical protein n=1 Tax=Wolbachia endosymbiont of Brugia pahangi TaxID=96495 RepID=UPI001439004E|nr:hypothetical protein [Wolbachia endosymbiont of Brugia pahangi]
MDYENQSHSNSNKEFFISNSRTSSPEIVLNGIPVESSSQLSSSSPVSSRSLESRRLSCDSNDISGHHL